MKEAFTRRVPHPWTNLTTMTRVTTGIVTVTIRTTNHTMSDTMKVQTRTTIDTTTMIIAMTRSDPMTMTGETMTMIGIAMIGVITPTNHDDTAMIEGDMMTTMMAGLGIATVALATMTTITTRMMTKTTSHTRNEAMNEHQAMRSAR